MNRSALLNQLQSAGLQTHTFSHGQSSLVVIPHGGRVLGLFTHDNADNQYFVNSELADPASAKKFLAATHVLGGDRLWLAPERGLFFTGNTENDGQVVQPSIDPGNWIVSHLTDRSISLTNSLEAHFYHHKANIRGTVTRSIRRIPSPFFHTPTALPNLDRTHFAGYEIASRFELLEAPKDDLYLGLWFLIQLPMQDPGYFYAPTAGKTVVTDYYEPTGPDYLRTTDTHVRFRLDANNRHKIGLRKTEALGRMAFLSDGTGSGGHASLVLRNFLNDPSAHYSDVPLHTPKGVQDSIQSYNHYTGTAGFGELEYHTPGICRAMPEPVVTDTNQVWAFTGRRADLVPIAAKLLNLAPDTFTP